MTIITAEISIPQHFADTARIWIYQANRPFSATELATLRPQLTAFCTRWTAHQQQLAAFGEVFYEQFIVLAVDEKQAGASGCSIDSSVHFLQQLEKEYQVALFDRLQFAYLDAHEQVQTLNRMTLKARFAEGLINDDTLFFDNLVNQLGAFRTSWLRPLGKSWHRRMV
jgi:hypothetical protein